MGLEIWNYSWLKVVTYTFTGNPTWMHHSRQVKILLIFNCIFTIHVSVTHMTKSTFIKLRHKSVFEGNLKLW